MEQASKPNMAGMLELSDGEFKTTMMNMLRVLMDNISSMQEQMNKHQLERIYAPLCSLQHYLQY